jgi:hypothetical protein
VTATCPREPNVIPCDVSTLQPVHPLVRTYCPEIGGRQVNRIATRPILEICREGERLFGSTRRRFWWERVVSSFLSTPWTPRAGLLQLLFSDEARWRAPPLPRIQSSWQAAHPPMQVTTPTYTPRCRLPQALPARYATLRSQPTTMYAHSVFPTVLQYPTIRSSSQSSRSAECTTSSNQPSCVPFDGAGEKTKTLTLRQEKERNIPKPSARARIVAYPRYGDAGDEDGGAGSPEAAAAAVMIPETNARPPSVSHRPEADAALAQYCWPPPYTIDLSLRAFRRASLISSGALGHPDGAAP